MQNFTNDQPQYSQASRGGPAFTSPEQQRPVQYTTLQNPNLLRGTGFTSPLQGAGAPVYPFYRQDQGPIPAQPVRYLSERQMIPGQPGLAEMARPGAIELTSTYAEVYTQRFATNVSSPLIPLSPQIYQLVAQSNTQTNNGAFTVQEGMAKDLKNIIEKNFIENNKRVLAEFFNDGNKQPQDITAQIKILSSSLQTQYDSLKNPSRSTSQVARNFSSPEPMRPNGTDEADTRANNYLKLRLNAVIESLSQIESEQTYNEIKQRLSRLVVANREITLDQKHDDLLGLNFQESRSSSTLSSPASLQSLPQARDGRAGILRQDSTRRIEKLEQENSETRIMYEAGQKTWLAESQRLQEENQKVERLTELKNKYEQTIYELTTKISSYDRNSARLNLIAQQEIEIEAGKQNIKELESQKQELETQLTNASQTNKSEKDQLNQRLQEKQTEIEDHQKKITELGILIALGKEGVESMNLEISEIKESLSKDIAEFERDASQHLEATDRIISEGMLKQEDNIELIQNLQQELSEIKMAYDELKNSSNELDRTQTDIDSTNRRLKALFGESQREVSNLKQNLISACELIKEKEEKLTTSENARKKLTGELDVENWLPASEPSGNELTTGDIERFTKWSDIDLTSKEMIEKFLAQQNSTAQQSSTLDQGTKTTDLPTQQLSQRVDAIAVAGAPSALSIVEQVAQQRRFALQQPDSSPSTSPRQTQENNQSRLMTEMQPSHDTMRT